MMKIESIEKRLRRQEKKRRPTEIEEYCRLALGIQLRTMEEIYSRVHARSAAIWQGDDDELFQSEIAYILNGDYLGKTWHYQVERVSGVFCAEIAVLFAYRMTVSSTTRDVAQELLAEIEALGACPDGLLNTYNGPLSARALWLFNEYYLVYFAPKPTA